MKVYTFRKLGDDAFAITSGNKRMIKIPLAPEGVITKVCIQQVLGEATSNFTVDLFDTEFIDEGYSSALTALPDTAEHYRIFPQKSATAGNAVVDYVTGELGYSYRNMDGSHTVPVRCLWLLIIPTGSVITSHWEVTITVENEIG